MKSKSVILSLLVMSLLVMAQIQVEANICCRTQSGRNGYILCTRFAMVEPKTFVYLLMIVLSLAATVALGHILTTI